MSSHPATPPSSSADRSGNGSTGTVGHYGSSVGVPPDELAAAGGPTGSATFPGGTAGSRDWTRSDETNRSEFGAFLDDLSELARGGGHADLRGEIERRVSVARERMSTALDQGVEMTARARDQMQRGIDYSRDAVVERPLSYLALAAVGGLLVGLLLARRD